MIAIEATQLPTSERVVTLMLDGELGEMEMADVCDELFRIAHRGHRNLVIDLTDVSHIDYRHVRPLVARARVFRNGGGDIKLAGLSPYLQAVFRAAGAQNDFEYYADPEQARASYTARLAS